MVGIFVAKNPVLWQVLWCKSQNQKLIKKIISLKNLIKKPIKNHDNKLYKKKKYPLKKSKTHKISKSY